MTIFTAGYAALICQENKILGQHTVSAQIPLIAGRVELLIPHVKTTFTSLLHTLLEPVVLQLRLSQEEEQGHQSFTYPVPTKFLLEESDREAYLRAIFEHTYQKLPHDQDRWTLGEYAPQDAADPMKAPLMPIHLHMHMEDRATMVLFTETLRTMVPDDYLFVTHTELSQDALGEAPYLVLEANQATRDIHVALPLPLFLLLLMLFRRKGTCPSKESVL